MPDEESYLDVSLRKIAKGAGIGFTGTFIGMALGYLSRMVIARFLGASDYGLICLGFAAMTIAATLSSIGLETGIKRFVPFYKGKGDEGRIKGTIISALKISFPLSLIFTFLFLFYAEWISIQVFHEPELAPVLRIFAIGIPFFVLANNFIAATVGFQDLRYRVYVNDVFQNVFKFLAIVILLALGFGVLGATWGWVLAIVLMPFLAFYFLEKRVFPILNTKVKAIPIGKELFSFSWPLILATVPGLLMGWMDTLMLGYFSAASAVGIYNAALPTAKLLSVVAGGFGVIFMPVITELYARNRTEDFRNTYSAVTKWALSLVFPAFLLMCVFSKSVIKIMFGEEYLVGATALSILAFAFLISSVIAFANPVLIAFGRTKIPMACSFVGAGVNFVLNFCLIPLYGVNGAAIATGFSVALMNVLLLFFVYRIGKIQPFRRSHLKPAFASIISVLIVYIATKYLIGESLPALIIMLLVFLILYFFLLLIFKSFEEEDLMIMRAIDQRIGTKSDWARRIIKRFL